MCMYCKATRSNAQWHRTHCCPHMLVACFVCWTTLQEHLDVITWRKLWKLTTRCRASWYKFTSVSSHTRFARFKSNLANSVFKFLSLLREGGSLTAPPFYNQALLTSRKWHEQAHMQTAVYTTCPGSTDLYVYLAQA